MLFSEREAGKAKSWTLITTVVVIVTLFNLAIIISVRVILDSEDEINEPIIQGEARQKLTMALGFFAMTFCFGCWCCFCCGGMLCQWLAYLPSLIVSLYNFLIDALMPTSSLKRDVNDDEMETVIVQPYVGGLPSDHHPFERPVFYDNFVAVDDQASSPAPPTRAPPLYPVNIGGARRERAYSIDVSFK